MVRGSVNAGAGEVPLSVTWRDGVHLTDTSIWCDALRARDVCFASAADRVRVTQHGQLIATAETIALLSTGGPKTSSMSTLPVPCGRPFTLGTLRLEVVRSGLCVGGASLLVTIGDRRVMYAGAVNPRGVGLDGPADVRSCDTLVVSARFGDPSVRFDEPEDVIARLASAVEEVTDAGATAAVVVDTVAMGLEVASRLAGVATGVAAHRSIHQAAQRIRATRALAPITRWTGSAQPGRVLVWPTNRLDALHKVKLPSGSQRMFVSGRVAEPATRPLEGMDQCFGWSDEADHEQLLQYIDATGAREVYLTHRYAEPLAHSLDGSRRRVRSLGPPRQMSLF